MNLGYIKIHRLVKTIIIKKNRLAGVHYIKAFTCSLNVKCLKNSKWFDRWK